MDPPPTAVAWSWQSTQHVIVVNSWQCKPSHGRQGPLCPIRVFQKVCNFLHFVTCRTAIGQRGTTCLLSSIAVGEMQLFKKCACWASGLGHLARMTADYGSDGKCSTYTCDGGGNSAPPGDVGGGNWLRERGTSRRRMLILSENFKK